MISMQFAVYKNLSYSIEHNYAIHESFRNELMTEPPHGTIRTQIQHNIPIYNTVQVNDRTQPRSHGFRAVSV